MADCPRRGCLCDEKWPICANADTLSGAVRANTQKEALEDDIEDEDDEDESDDEDGRGDSDQDDGEGEGLRLPKTKTPMKHAPLRQDDSPLTKKAAEKKKNRSGARKTAPTGEKSGRVRWTSEQEAELIECMRGKRAPIVNPCKWAQIADHILVDGTQHGGMKVRDKWRNLSKSGRVPDDIKNLAIK